MDIPKSLLQRAQPNSLETYAQESTSQANEFKLAHLFRLGQHYWPKDFSKGQAKEFLKDYLEDLANFSAAQVDTACSDWRRGIGNKRFPRTAELAASIAERIEISKPKPKLPDESRPILWWHQSRELWQAHWREDEIPKDSLNHGETLNADQAAGVIETVRQRYGEEYLGSKRASDEIQRAKDAAANRVPLAYQESDPAFLKLAKEASQRKQW